MAAKGFKRANSMSLGDAAALRKQAEEIELTNRLSTITAVLRKEPLYIPVVENALKQAGVVLENVLVEAEAPPAKKAKAGAVVTQTTILPKCEVYFGMLSGPSLSALLFELETCYTPESLTRLKPSPRKAIPKQSLLALLEFLTGMRPDTWIGTSGKLKEFHYLSQALQTLNTKRGRRGRDVRLPPSWGQDGVYRVEARDDDDGIQIVHKFVGGETPLVRCLGPDHVKMIRDRAALTIEKNWSEVDALLVEVRGKIRLRLSVLFQGHVEENALASIGEFPDNPADHIPKPATLDAGMIKMLEADSFSRYRSPHTTASSETLGGDSHSSFEESPGASSAHSPQGSASLRECLQNSQPLTGPIGAVTMCEPGEGSGSSRNNTSPAGVQGAVFDKPSQLPCRLTAFDESQISLQKIKELPK